jgi:predicted metalloprotease with PDZ domain
MNRFLLITATVMVLLLSAAPAALADEPAEAEPDYTCSHPLNSCLDWMAKHYGSRGWAGMQLDVEGMTYTVTGVHEGSPAQKGGIKAGDILVAVNGVDYAEENEEKLLAIQQTMKPGVQFTYTVKRRGKRRNVECVLVEMPVDVVAQQVGMHLITGHLDPDRVFAEDE